VDTLPLRKIGHHRDPRRIEAAAGNQRTSCANSPGPVFHGDRGERHRLDPACLAGAAELLVAFDADGLGRQHCRLQIVARIELCGILVQVLANGGGHGQPNVGVDVDFAHAVLDAFLDFLDRYAVRLLHVAAISADVREQVLRHRRAAVHDEVRIRDSRVDRLDAVDREDVLRSACA
jgi:hypothetical protein